MDALYRSDFMDSGGILKSLKILASQSVELRLQKIVFSIEPDTAVQVLGDVKIADRVSNNGELRSKGLVMTNTLPLDFSTKAINVKDVKGMFS